MIGGPVVPRASKLSATPPLAGQGVRGGERLGAAEARLLGVGEDDDDVVAQLRARGQRAHRLEQRRHPGARRRCRRGRSRPSRGGPSGTAGRSGRSPAGRRRRCWTRAMSVVPARTAWRRPRAAPGVEAEAGEGGDEVVDHPVVRLAAGDVRLGGDLLHVREGARGAELLRRGVGGRGRRRLQGERRSSRRGRGSRATRIRPASRPGRRPPRGRSAGTSASWSAGQDAVTLGAWAPSSRQVSRACSASWSAGGRRRRRSSPGGTGWPTAARSPRRRRSGRRARPR